MYFSTIYYILEGVSSFILQYFQPLINNNYTISIDNIVIDYYLSSIPHRESFVKMLEKFSLEYYCELKHWTTFKIGTFKMQFTITFSDNSSFWIGIGLNEGKTNYGRVRLDFNPNKTAQHLCLRKVLSFLNLNAHRIHTLISRYDLAIDLPVSRENIFLVKDNRAYSERRHGKEWTQYLGPNSHVGRVKLYNKQVESKLDFPLTRLELTLDPAQTYDVVNWPKVYYIKTMQMKIAELSMTDTERFILNALLQGCGNLSQLGRKSRAKMEHILADYTESVQIAPSSFDAIRSQLFDFLDYPIKELKIENLNLDVPVYEPETNSDNSFAMYNNLNNFQEVEFTGELPFDV